MSPCTLQISKLLLLDVNSSLSADLEKIVYSLAWGFNIQLLLCKPIRFRSLLNSNRSVHFVVYSDFQIPPI